MEECEELNISECMSSKDEENPIKSDATVKYQMVQSPANFARLKCNTDLNVPPTNWLNSSINSYGLQQALSPSTGFSSFRMAHLFPDCLGEVDVVANAENIKRLLKLPYAANCAISMMVHRIGNTLLIDDFDVHRFLLQQEDCNWQWLRSFICDHILSRLNDAERNLLVKQPTSRSDAIQQRNLLSKFLYHSLPEPKLHSGSESASISTSDVTESKVNLDIECAQLTSHLQYGPLLPDPSVEENVPDPKHTQHTYNRNVIWTFEDIRMLIGTDMPIFGGSTRPCISLRLRDMHKPINVLTGIDYWLDNLMCNVPEVVMCYHLDGFVKKYEIIKTEDLPQLEDSNFSPNVIRNVAQNILSFLKQNATKSGHTYWLFKGRKDDVVKLYDLTSLCTANEFGQNSTNANRTNHQNPENLTKKDDQNPFTVPVAMLLYKVARNMKHSNAHIQAKKAGSIKALLDNCIKLLPKETYPQIVASSYYLLSDLHIPSGTDPMLPKFDEESNGSEYSYDDDNIINSDDSGSTSVEDEQSPNQSGGSIAVQNVVDVMKESNFQEIGNGDNSLPPPLIGTVHERCLMALQYVAHGLNCLQYFSMNEAKLAKEREEMEKQAEKMRIIQEEQNPNMAKPYQAIPLPYEQLKRNDTNPSIVKDRNALNKDGEENAQKLNGNTNKTSSNEIGEAQPTVVQSWNIHLKLLFLEKCCLIYTIYTEDAYRRERFGSALNYISLAIKYYEIISKHRFYCTSIGSNYRSNLLARAGDCYFQLSHQESIYGHLNDYDSKRRIDADIERELEKDFKEIDTNIEIKRPVNSMEQLIWISVTFYESALLCADETRSRDELLSRLGCVNNELGVKYMYWSQNLWQKSYPNVDSGALIYHIETVTETDTENENTRNKPMPGYLNLAMKAYDCLARGINIFEQINDKSNLAILLCNMGRYMRFRAHVHIDKGFVFKKQCYASAFMSYERALTILESKKQNEQLWDLVIWELSTGKFTLAKHILDHFGTNNKFEQEVIELFLGSLKLCDTTTGSSRQNMYIVRTGLIYQNLGTIYGRSYKTANDKTQKKKLLNLCRLYYEKGIKIFQNIDAPTEFLGVQNDRLQFQATLFEGCQTPSQKLKCIQTALSIAFEAIDQFDKIEKLDDNNKIVVGILKQFELHVQTLLKYFVQVSISKQCDASSVAEYKRIYCLTLQSSVKRDELLEFSTHLKNILQVIQKSAVNQS